jgi:N-acetylglutamate synthase
VEFSGAGYLKIRITAADVGKRVTVRRVDDTRDTPGGFTDTVGVLTSWDHGVLVITRRDGERVRFTESALVAGKVVPAAPARRRGPAASYRELARVVARGWPPVERDQLGEWELRAASGFTRRANSALPLGDPGLPQDAALAAVRRWYAERGQPAYLQAATGAEGTDELLCAALEDRGWVREVSAEVWIGALPAVVDRGAARQGTAGEGAAKATGQTAEVELSRTADEAWLTRYQRKGLSDVALKVLGGGPSVWFATVPSAGGGAPVAIGRCVVDGRWAGFAAVEVAPGHRREGLATTVMTALAQRAMEEGASAAWLQVESDNTAALALYTGLGFGRHHAYHHYRAPEDRVSGELVSGELVSGELVSEVRTSECDTSESGTSEGRVPEGRTPDDRASEDRAPDAA